MRGPDHGQGPRALARLSSGVLLTNILAAVAALGATVLTARAFGPGGRGEFTLATQFVTLVVTLGSFGLAAAAAYQTARARWPRAVAFGNSILLGLVLGVVIAGGCGAVVLGADATFRGLPKGDLAIAVIAVPFALAVGNVQGIYQGLRNFKAFNAITVAQASLPLLLIGVAIAAGGGVHAAIVASVVASVLLFVAAIAHARRSTSLTWRFNAAYARALASYGIRAHPANVLAYLGYRLDVFLVDGYKGAAAVGLYGAGVVIAETLWMPSQAVSTALFPAIAAERTESARRSITPLIARTTLWLTTILAGILFVAAGAVVDLLYSSRFSSSAGAVRILAPGIVLFSAARVLGNDIAARGKPLVNSIVAAVSVGFNIALNVLLIPRYGIDGAAWASTGSYSFVFLATMAVYRNVAGVPLGELVIPTREDGVRCLRLVRQSVGRLHASPGRSR
jgi:O-antigen/teichoic acid export membrane protein